MTASLLPACHVSSTSETWYLIVLVYKRVYIHTNLECGFLFLPRRSHRQCCFIRIISRTLYTINIRVLASWKVKLVYIINNKQWANHSFYLSRGIFLLLFLLKSSVCLQVEDMELNNNIFMYIHISRLYVLLTLLIKLKFLHFKRRERWSVRDEVRFIILLHSTRSLLTLFLLLLVRRFYKDEMSAMNHFVTMKNPDLIQRARERDRVAGSSEQFFY